MWRDLRCAVDGDSCNSVWRFAAARRGRSDSLSGHTSTTPWATAQGDCATKLTASASVAASITAKPADHEMSGGLLTDPELPDTTVSFPAAYLRNTASSKGRRRPLTFPKIQADPPSTRTRRTRATVTVRLLLPHLPFVDIPAPTRCLDLGASLMRVLCHLRGWTYDLDGR